MITSVRVIWLVNNEKMRNISLRERGKE